MRSVGIDIGSRSIELVLLDNGKIIETRQQETGYEPMKGARKLLDGIPYDQLMVTGYGRNLMEIAFEAQTVTEIKAHAMGAKAFFPSVRTVLDIGGQDCKAIAVNPAGKVTRFEMNDRCASGTGKFLEVMARSLGFELDEFGKQAMTVQKYPQINSMCTVFAESEVISLVARGENRHEIALALHVSIVQRVAGLLRRVWTDGDLVFTGGVAKNPCIRDLLAQSLEQEILVPDDPQMMGALGAALLACENSQLRKTERAGSR